MKLEYCLNSLVLKQINKDKGRVYKECITNRCKDTVKALYKCIKKTKQNSILVKHSILYKKPKTMQQVTNTNQDQITSLELVKQINLFREQESNRTEL